MTSTPAISGSTSIPIIRKVLAAHDLRVANGTQGRAVAMDSGTSFDNIVTRVAQEVATRDDSEPREEEVVEDVVIASATWSALEENLMSQTDVLTFGSHEISLLIFDGADFTFDLEQDGIDTQWYSSLYEETRAAFLSVYRGGKYADPDREVRDEDNIIGTYVEAHAGDPCMIPLSQSFAHMPEETALLAEADMESLWNAKTGAEAEQRAHDIYELFGFLEGPEQREGMQEFLQKQIGIIDDAILANGSETGQGVTLLTPLSEDDFTDIDMDSSELQGEWAIVADTLGDAVSGVKEWIVKGEAAIASRIEELETAQSESTNMIDRLLLEFPISALEMIKGPADIVHLIDHAIDTASQKLNDYIHTAIEVCDEQLQEVDQRLSENIDDDERIMLELQRNALATSKMTMQVMEVTIPTSTEGWIAEYAIGKGISKIGAVFKVLKAQRLVTKNVDEAIGLSTGETSQTLRKLKQQYGSTVNVEHIASAAIRRKGVVGGHILDFIKNQPGVRFTNVVEGSNGVKGGVLEIWDEAAGVWKKKPHLHTTFPDSWSSDKCIRAVQEAFEKAVAEGQIGSGNLGNDYHYFIDGIEIVVKLVDGKLDEAFPIFVK